MPSSISNSIKEKSIKHYWMRLFWYQELSNQGRSLYCIWPQSRRLILGTYISKRERWERSRLYCTCTCILYTVPVPVYCILYLYMYQAWIFIVERNHELLTFTLSLLKVTFFDFPAKIMTNGLKFKTRETAKTTITSPFYTRRHHFDVLE